MPAEHTRDAHTQADNTPADDSPTSDHPSEPGCTEATGCTAIEDVMGVLGRAWAGAILEAMLQGHDRFTDLATAVPGVTPGVLTTRLREFCTWGLAERTVAPGPPTSVTYRLTTAGRDVAPVLDALRSFGTAHPEVRRPR